MSDTDIPLLDASVDARKYYINAIMDDVEGVQRKSFRRLILLYYIIEFEGLERHGEAWDDWITEKRDTVNATHSNFIRELTLDRVKLMRPTAALLCSEQDIEFVYSMSDETLREYLRLVKVFRS